MKNNYFSWYSAKSKMAPICVNRKWKFLDEILVFRDWDLDIWIQRAKLYQKLHRKYNFLIHMAFKKQSNLQSYPS